MHNVIPDHSPGSIYPDWLQTLEKKYNIVDVFNFVRYDYQLDQLKQRLLAVKKPAFDAHDRIVAVHFDTDYYIQGRVGVNLTNLFTIWQEADIPFHTMFEGMGGYGELVERRQDLGPALKRAIASGKTACLNVKAKGVISPIVAATASKRDKASIE